MTALKEYQWKRLAAEALAIIVSILFAFAIDAWWDDRKSSRDERILLQSLVEDLYDKKEMLVGDRIYNQAIARAVTGLLTEANSVDSTIGENAIDRMIGDTWWFNAESDWDSAPMTSLIGGEIASVSNPALVQKLAELQVQMARIRNFYKIDEDFHHNTYTPFLVANAYMPQITGKTEHYPGRPDLEYEYPQFTLETTQNHSLLIRQKEFQNMMIAKLDRVQDILQNAYRYIDRDLDEAITLLNQELARTEPP
jgi:hypothetical protein